MRDDYGWGYSGFAHAFGFVVYGFFALLSLAVTAALIFFLVRFLIYGTKAAQLYIAKNSPAKAAAPVTEPATRGPVEPSPGPVGPTTTPTGSATVVDTPAEPVVVPKATPPITPPATKKPPVKKTPNPPVA